MEGGSKWEALMMRFPKVSQGSNPRASSLQPCWLAPALDRGSF